MRSLATGSYTAAEIEAQLRSSNRPVGRRFEVLDRTGSKLGDLTTVLAEPGAATVEVNVDRAIKGSLDLQLTPDEDLRYELFRRRIKAWWQLGMPDGGIAEFPQGVYVWTKPSRSLPAHGVERWSITLGDQLHQLDVDGPGPGGFAVRSTDVVTDKAVEVLTRAGIADTSGVVPSDETFDEPKGWCFVTPRNRARRRREYFEQLLAQTTGSSAAARQQRAYARQQIARYSERAPDTDNSPVSWLGILTDMFESIGYYSPFFDLDGVFRGVPYADLATAAPDLVLEAGPTGIMLPDVEAEPDLSRIANRVMVRPSNAQGVSTFATADANKLFPGHPLSQAEIGFYIDEHLDDAVAGSRSALNKRARAELSESLSWYEAVDVPSLAWPVHDPFDIVGVQITGDAELGDMQIFHQRRHTLDLFTGDMARNLRRIWRPTS